MENIQYVNRKGLSKHRKINCVLLHNYNNYRNNIEARKCHFFNVQRNKSIAKLYVLWFLLDKYMGILTRYREQKNDSSWFLKDSG